MVPLLEDIDLEYYKYFIYTYKLRRKCMYAESKKSIYGTLEVSLLFWVKLSKILEEMGYQRNEYEWCVMNKIIDDKQCTILWHFDDLNTSHVDPSVISSVLSDIDVEYGKIAKMTITRGKLYKYLGMTIYYSSPGKLIFSMIDYIGKKYPRIHEGVIINACCTPPLWHCRRCNQTVPGRRGYFPLFCSTTAIYFKEGTSRHPGSSIFPVH